MSEQLLTLLVFGLLAAISTWISKKRQEHSNQSMPPPRRPSPGEPPPATVGWEDQIRRLLEGQSPAPPPLVTPTMNPPQNRPEPPPQVLAPAGRAVPPIYEQSLSTDERFQHVKAFHAEARKRKAQAETQLRLAMEAAPKQPSIAGAGESVRRILQDREALRAAFVVSLLFGPPKGLAE